MLRKKYYTYNKIVNWMLEGKLVYFNRYRTSKKMTNVEKRLLQARYYIIHKQWDKAINLLDIQTINCPLLEGDKLFLIGTTKISMSDYQGAVIFLNRAILKYQFAEDRRGSFLSYFNCSVAYQKMGLSDLSKFHLKRASELAEGNNEKLLIARSKICNYTIEGDHENACRIIDETMPAIKDKEDLDHVVFKTVAASVFIEAERFNDALLILEKISKNKINKAKARAIFEYHVLQALISKKELKRKPQGINDSNEFLLKWDILIAVQSGDKVELIKKWQELIQMKPHVFKENFECINKYDEKNIFMRYLKTKLQDAKNTEAVCDISQIKGNKLKKLYSVLKKSNMSLRKEIIIQEIWGNYHPNYDSRFYQLIKRLKKLTGLKIINQNNCYSIKN